MQKDFINGVINYPDSARKPDSLYRISIKGLVVNERGEVLVVKETGRTGWDIPGGGMDHGETIKDAIARELYEEVSLQGDFDYRVIAVEDPSLLKSASILQVRIVFQVIPQSMKFTAGEDGDEVMFADPRIFKDSNIFAEHKVYEYAKLIY